MCVKAHVGREGEDGHAAATYALLTKAKAESLTKQKITFYFYLLARTNLYL